MFFNITLYLSLTICIIGIIYRISSWFRLKVGADASDFTFNQRVIAGVECFFTTIFTAKIITMLKVFIIDIILQLNIKKASQTRWIMHILIFFGFMALLLMHAFDKLITAKIFGADQAYVNPFLFLREIFGLMVLSGIAIAVYRRYFSKKLNLRSNKMDLYAIIILAVIIISGIVLESVKMTSYSDFQRMAQSYNVKDEELKPLETYWAKEFGTVSSNISKPFDENALKEGKDYHDMYCASCHSANKSAFVGYAFAKIITPAAASIDKLQISNYNIFWYIHILACFIGLAYLPFGKFFHLVSTPFNLIARPANTSETLDKALLVNQRLLGLDACTHCYECSAHCSVGPIFKSIANVNILPSEKLISIKKLSAQDNVNNSEISSVSEGTFICTECYRCTIKCPSRINLQDIWISSKKDLEQKGFSDVHIWIKQKKSWEWAEKIKNKTNFIVKDFLSNNAQAFNACVQCSTCTNVCPVVANLDYPSPDLDLTPQQVMNLLRLNLKEVAMSSKMVWNCLTCYMCQEHCPEGIKIADIMYELRNLAYMQLKDIRRS